MRCR